ncbi:murein biosynthesis integral membrane protein MurJ [Ectothiorhodospiraceae bacterium WFHF3C12]|nr:murein biosynthesis integral membrane protein MurJ [Ectothiorhodospiraceae bacterium WFHF3C12]
MAGSKGSGLLGSVFTFGSMTLVSRVLGLVRDVALATLGPGLATDAFFVAFKIPNFMRRLFAEGAFAQAVVPVLSEVKAGGDEARVRRLVSHVSGALAMVLVALTVLGVVFSSQVITLFAPGFLEDPGKFALASELLRWTFPYLLLISLTACAGAVLNTYGRFGPPAFAPVLLNLCLIAAALWGTWVFDSEVKALAVAVLVAGFAQLLLQLPFLGRVGMLVWPVPIWSDPGVKRVLKLMTPALFGSSVAQINLLVDTVLASFLMTGSVTWLYFSDRLVEFPLGVFGVAIGTVILPRLSGQHADASPEGFSHTMDWALRWVLLIAAPATLALMMLSGPILSTLFQHGGFSVTDVLAARLSLMAYSVGLAGFILVKVLAPGFFARQDMRTPVRYAAGSMIMNMVLSTGLVLWLIETGVGHAAVALATGLAQTLNAVLLYRGLRRRDIYRPNPGWGRLWRRVSVACAAMGAVLYWPAGNLASWTEADTLARISLLLGFVGAGAAVYFLALYAQGWRLGAMREPVQPQGE